MRDQRSSTPPAGRRNDEVQFAAGLVHRVDEFVCASRPAVRFCQLLRE
jgi:hypothetical protein